MASTPTRRTWLALTIVVILSLLWWSLPFWLKPRFPAGDAAPASAGTSRLLGGRAPTDFAVRESLHLAQHHGHPSSSVAEDLRLVQAVLEAWQTNLLGDGNPVGDNRDITSALLGRNRLQIAFIDAQHPSINAQGEWMDRWGTPYRFHALDGQRMEVSSAGPDRRFGTDDDVGTFQPAP